MKEVQLTQGYVALVDDEDYERVNSFSWQAAKRSNTTYAVGRTPNGQLLMHRYLTSITDPKIKVDHEDHNGLNNQRHNMRVCSHAQNCSGQKVNTCNTSGFKGVSFFKRDRNWSAYIKTGGKKKHLGYYPTANEAAAVYDAEAVRMFGEYALTNAKLTQQERV